MARKSFLSRIDNQKSNRGKSSANKDADEFIKTLNNASKQALEYMARFIPGAHKMKISHKTRRMHRKQKGINGKF